MHATYLFFALTFCIPVFSQPLDYPESRHHTVETVSGKAVRIIDGDTFELLLPGGITERIRLHGIDCPERNQPFSQVAKDKLAALIFGRIVYINRMNKDRYGRTIAMVYDQQVNVNEAMLIAGLAWHFKRYDQNPLWAQLEKTASTKKIGLWFDAHAIAPWEWRKR